MPVKKKAAEKKLSIEETLALIPELVGRVAALGEALQEALPRISELEGARDGWIAAAEDAAAAFRERELRVDKIVARLENVAKDAEAVKEMEARVVRAAKAAVTEAAVRGMVQQGLDRATAEGSRAAKKAEALDLRVQGLEAMIRALRLVVRVEPAAEGD